MTVVIRQDIIGLLGSAVGERFTRNRAVVQAVYFFIFLCKHKKFGM